MRVRALLVDVGSLAHAVLQKFLRKCTSSIDTGLWVGRQRRVTFLLFHGIMLVSGVSQPAGPENYRRKHATDQGSGS
jgi:hypothetical protein